MFSDVLEITVYFLDILFMLLVLVVIGGPLGAWLLIQIVEFIRGFLPW